MFAFVNATTQLISTRRVAHRADKGAALLQNLHTYICCCNPTHSHTRTLARTHARTKGDTLQWLHCCSLVAGRKEVGGRAVTTQKSNSNSRSRSRSLWARSVFPLLSLFNSACMSFPFVWFLFLNNYNIQKIILFSLYKFNFVFRAHTHAHARTALNLVLPTLASAGFDCPASTECDKETNASKNRCLCVVSDCLS